jgi:hypothetical protein
MGWHDWQLAQFGGIAHTAELYRLGASQSSLFFSVGYGTIIRVRNGLYCHPALPVEVIRALRVGGRLACVSALAHHGVGESPHELHVDLDANTPRLRDPDSGEVVRAAPGVVAHWSRRPRAGDRSAVSVDEARRQAARCRALARDSL